MYFHRGSILLSIGVGVDDGLADDVGVALFQFARILTHVTTVFVGVHLRKDGSRRGVTHHVASGGVPMSVASGTRCGGSRSVGVFTVGTHSNEVERAFHTLAG